MLWYAMVLVSVSAACICSINSNLFCRRAAWYASEACWKASAAALLGLLATALDALLRFSDGPALGAGVVQLLFGKTTLCFMGLPSHMLRTAVFVSFQSSCLLVDHYLVFVPEP